MRNMNLIDYFNKELENNFEYVYENINDLYDIVDYALEYAYGNGTLTYSTREAEEAILDNYNFEEIIEKFKDYNTDRLNAEVIMIELVREEAMEELEDKLKSVEKTLKVHDVELKEKELIKYTLLDYVKENDIDISDYTNEQLKNFLEKY